MKLPTFQQEYNYDILANTRYQESFQFYSILEREVDEDQRDENMELKPLKGQLKWRVSDFVTKVLNGANEGLSVDYDQKYIE